MTREQAINYLISRGFTNEQVGEVVRALTYKPRDCANCKHYVVTDTRTNWGSQETTKIYGCECWECEYEPTTKNDSSGLDKNSKKLEEPQTFKWCTDCKEYDQEKHCCHRWSNVIRDTVEEMKQESILDKIRAEIETKYGQCDICEYFEDYDYEENDISEYRPIGNIADILQIIDKYKAESEK